LSGHFLIFLYIYLPCEWPQIWHISLKPNPYNEHCIIKICLAFSVTFTALRWVFHKEIDLLLQQFCEWSRCSLYSRGTGVSTAEDTLMWWALMKMQQASFSKCLVRLKFFQRIFPIRLLINIIKLCFGRRRKKLLHFSRHSCWFFKFYLFRCKVFFKICFQGSSS